MWRLTVASAFFAMMASMVVGQLPTNPGYPNSGYTNVQQPAPPQPGPVGGGIPANGQSMYQPPMPIPSSRYPGVNDNHCRYLMEARAAWGVNTSPFRLSAVAPRKDVMIRQNMPIEG